MSLTDPQSFNNLLLSSNQWFDYTPEMNEILNVLHKRIFNLEIALQANNQISNRSHTMIRQNQFSQELTANSIDTISQQSIRNSLISDQHLTLEKQLDKLNLSSHISFEQTTMHSTTNPLSSSSSVNLSPNQMKTRSYEFAAIFEDGFDQLNIIHNSLSINNHNQFPLNLTGTFIKNKNDKFHYEINYFFRILMLLFRALLLDCQTDFVNSVHKTHNNLPSKELIDLNNRLKISQEQISNFSFIKKYFHKEKSEQLNILHSTKAQLKDHLMEEKTRSKISFHYCTNWKKNHILQWIQMLLQIEHDYIKTIQQYEINLKQIEITHQETIKILIQQKTEMKSNANKWYEYYQNETTRFEKELTNFRYEFDQIKKQRENMYEEYQRMKIIVDEYNQMKITEKLLLEKQKQQEQTIKQIQAWWRGTMIRRIKRKKKKR